eukprot:TRINITY_DN56769_c0_g1_i1.p1 TRINITY_DN56769_c0_g1~~TRINITY_DN56769_c0_g1_i1.p1  ORF type:complete len:603 (+),score=103.19 TRINITY_DN56769_c0_g1_i1:107-1915(+)
MYGDRANAKNSVLEVFRELDEDGSGTIGKDILEEFFRMAAASTDIDVLNEKINTLANPLTGGVDYTRFLDWLWFDGPLAARPSTIAAPVLAMALQNLLRVEPPAKNIDLLPTPAVKPVAVSGMSLLERRRKKMADAKNEAEKPILPSKWLTSDSSEPTVTGRSIAQQPILIDVAGTKESDYKEMVSKEPEGTRAVLQQMADMLSRDVFGLPFSVSIAIPHMQDTPLIGISDGFTELTGYSRDEIIGRNCRFLLEGVPPEMVQDQTRQESRRYCRAAHLRGLTTMSHTFLIQRNARKNGDLFWNLFMLAFVPAPGESKGKANYIVGLQLDLGPGLDLQPGNDIASVIEPHRKNLEIVEHLMFGQRMHRELEADTGGISEHFEKLGEHLADDVSQWIAKAEESSAAYQQYGSLPFAVWPATSKYATLNGGCTLLRLEADEAPSGGLAMSIFPVRKTRKGFTFKLQVDDLCGFERDVAKGGWLPSLGFTELSPWDVDGRGGLPCKMEMLPQGVWMRGDGHVFVQSQDLSGAADGVSAGCAEAAFPHVLNIEDNIEFVWGSGGLELAVNGETLYRLKNSVIPKPSKKPMYALVDCCYAACKTTLVV